MNREQKKEQLLYQKNKLKYERERLKRKKLLEKGLDEEFENKERLIAELKNTLKTSKENLADYKAERRTLKLKSLVIYLLVLDIMTFICTKTNHTPFYRDYLKKYLNIKTTYSEYEDLKTESTLNKFNMNGEVIAYCSAWKLMEDGIFNREVTYYQVTSLNEEEIFDFLTTVDSYILDQFFNEFSDSPFTDNPDASPFQEPLLLSHINSYESDFWNTEIYDIDEDINSSLKLIFGEPIDYVVETRNSLNYEELERPPYLESISYLKSDEPLTVQETIEDNLYFSMLYAISVTVINSLLAYILHKKHKEDLKEFKEQFPIKNIKKIEKKLKKMGGYLNRNERESLYLNKKI